MYYKVKDTTYWLEKGGSGPALLLFHGFTGSTSTWKAFIKKWQETFTVITIDLPGHGKTSSEIPITMKSFCEDVAEILQSFSLGKVHLLGYSMGGRTALSFACLFPDLVNKLILESASPGLRTDEERMERQKKDEKLAEMIERDGVKAFVEYWEDIPLFETQKQMPLEKRQAVRRERLLQSSAGLTMSLRNMGTGWQTSWWDHLEGLFVPTLLLVGAQDNKFMKINKNMHESLPQSDFRIVEDAGHAIHVEQPEIFGNIVDEFLLER
ncbi:2-succinyl-6-hydroxy-2,4-cyclohexadiene-1-carboxylate synthase [Oceanobacillus manasiensis]|uniref:2-succinyl-6-hydroxy-2, 4-cyclohexadiene-1-carboxylate synthase n=1 Tax=Oceanobacillus manasiensis TaxID=586413 RepID=UPI0005AB3561|nr:2-succinyl-6-hydroxy-2,4-cyclohexadiene-1-carboxylate synthase [Oceanobacillus manasiensis]